MNSSKSAILGRIRGGLKRGPLNDQQQDALRNELKSPTRTLQPARVTVSGQAAIDDFKAMALESAAEVIELADLTHLPQKIAELMSKGGIKQPLVIANEPNITALDWQASNITTETRVAKKGDGISLTNSLCGIAETGTVALTSGPNSPTTLNFLPDTHCVILKKSSIVGGYEDAWDLVRQGKLPRTVNFITGPSRSGDIEQTLLMGAHGPVGVVIFLVE